MIGLSMIDDRAAGIKEMLQLQRQPRRASHHAAASTAAAQPLRDTYNAGRGASTWTRAGRNVMRIASTAVWERQIVALHRIGTCRVSQHAKSE
eukprot:COSAG01_NODE_179_length_22923_cov_25.190535_17_plen_93_part_00